MISKVDIVDPNKTPVSWLGKVAAFAKPREITFKPGLNIVFGPNGCGKTTLLTLLATMFHAKQANRSVVTQDSIQEMFFHSFDPASVVVSHDGQGIGYFDPSHKVGLGGGGAYFDWDVLDGAAFSNLLARDSSGQSVLRRIEPLLAGDTTGIEWKLNKKLVNDFWRKRVEVVEKFFGASASKGQPTVVLDEPDRSLDFVGQAGLWRFFRAHADERQFIVSSHSLFALKIPEANYVELDSEHLKRGDAALSVLAGWSSERPQKRVSLNKGKGSK